MGLGRHPGGLLRASNPTAAAVGVGAAKSAGAVPASGAPLLAGRPWLSRLQWSSPSARRPQLAREARPGAPARLSPLESRAHPPCSDSQVIGPAAGGQQQAGSSGRCGTLLACGLVPPGRGCAANPTPHRERASLGEKAGWRQAPAYLADLRGAHVSAGRPKGHPVPTSLRCCPGEREQRLYKASISRRLHPGS